NARSAYNAADARRDPMRIVTGVIVGTAAVAIASMLPRNVMLPLNFLIVFSIVAVLALTTERWLVDLAVRQAYARGIGLRKAVIVGRHGEVQELIAALTEDIHGDHCIAGYVTPSHVIDSQALGSVDDIDAILDRTDPAELILSSSLGPDILRRVAN